MLTNLTSNASLGFELLISKEKNMALVKFSCLTEMFGEIWQLSRKIILQLVTNSRVMAPAEALGN
jgi:hypothetical protein